MALKPRFCKATYKFHDSALKLSTRFEKLEHLRDAVDGDPHLFLANALNAADAGEMKGNIVKVFLALQDDVEEYSESDIQDAFFGDFSAFFNEENLKEVAVVVGHLLGQDISAKLSALDTAEPTEKKD